MLWNQRRQNCWIFIELVIVTFFLWTAIDPIYVLISDMTIPVGYKEERAYALYMGYYDELHGKYDKKVDSTRIKKENLNRIVRVVKNCPEVESYALVSSYSFPNAPSWNGGQFYNDTLMVHSQHYSFVQTEGSDLFRVYGMKDAKTGQIMSIPIDCAARKGVFITENLAMKLFGTMEAVGKNICYGDSTRHEVMGVLQNYKHWVDEQPTTLLIELESELLENEWLQWAYNVTFRLKPEVDAIAFEKRFKEEVAPQLAIGNFYFQKISRFAEIRQRHEDESGVTNRIRLQYALSGFALLCVFLGMVGTFWIRCNARKQDIGLMRSMGATSVYIGTQFMLETWLLVTVAFTVSLPLITHYVFVSGFAKPTQNGSLEFWQNRPLIHFSIVTALTYTILLITALLGTCIPVSRALNVRATEALRGE